MKNEEVATRNVTNERQNINIILYSKKDIFYLKAKFNALLIWMEPAKAPHNLITMHTLCNMYTVMQ